MTNERSKKLESFEKARILFEKMIAAYRRERQADFDAELDAEIGRISGLWHELLGQGMALTPSILPSFPPQPTTSSSSSPGAKARPSPRTAKGAVGTSEVLPTTETASIPPEPPATTSQVRPKPHSLRKAITDLFPTKETRLRPKEIYSALQASKHIGGNTKFAANTLTALKTKEVLASAEDALGSRSSVLMQGPQFP